MERALPHLTLYSNSNSNNVDMNGFSLICGLDVIAEILYMAGTTCYVDSSPDTHKLKYDTIIFCLNTLANVVESSGGFDRIGEIKIFPLPPSSGDDNCNTAPDQSRVKGRLFLSWLTQWLTDETSSFRDVLLDSSTAIISERKFENTDSERLVTAGNGFVLLSCLLIKDNYKKGSSLPSPSSTDKSIASSMSSISNSILIHLPGSDNSSKIQYIRSTLVAFCNFYHYSLGELSVAVVAPVKVIISRLDNILRKGTSN
jgi:hypothetical protein